jgi:hypothetical protein
VVLWSPYGERVKERERETNYILYNKDAARIRNYRTLTGNIICDL